MYEFDHLLFWKVFFKTEIANVEKDNLFGFYNESVSLYLAVEPLSTLSYNTYKENSDVNFLGRLIFEHFLSYFEKISDIEKRIASIRITYEWHTDTYQALQQTCHVTGYAPAKKPGNIRVIFPNFEKKNACCKKSSVEG